MIDIIKNTNICVYLNKFGFKINICQDGTLNEQKALEEITIKIIVIERIQQEYIIAHEYFSKEINEDYYLKGSQKLNPKDRETYKNMGKLLKQINMICTEICSVNTSNTTIDHAKKKYENNANNFFYSILRESYLADVDKFLSQERWENSIMRKARSSKSANKQTLLTEEHDRVIKPLKNRENPFKEEEEPHIFEFVEAAIELSSNSKWKNYFYLPFVKYYTQCLRDRCRSGIYGNTECDGKAIYMNSGGGGRSKNKLTPVTYTEREIQELFRKATWTFDKGL